MQQKYTMGVLIGNANSPHSMDMIRGIYHTAKSQNINLIFYLGIHSYTSYRTYFKEDAEDDYEYQVNVVYDYTNLAKLDCLIIPTGSLSIYMNNVKGDFFKRFHGLPYVLLEDIDENGTGSSIITENYAGMQKIVSHMIEVHGCTELTYLSGPLGNKDADLRKQAFMDTIIQYDLPFDESRIAYGDFTQDVEEQVNELLERHPQMDVILCANDLMADCVYRVFEKKGIEVGKDIYVTGYDDWERAEFMDPPLTTVRQNSYEMGAESIYEAMRLCEGEKPRSTISPAKVIFRESCGCRQKNAFLKWKKSILYSRTEELADSFIRKVRVNSNSENISAEVRTSILRFFDTDFDSEDSIRHTYDEMKRFLKSYEIEVSSLREIEVELDDYLYAKIAVCVESGEGLEKAGRIMRFRQQIRELLVNFREKIKDSKASSYQLENWFLPLISKDMISNMDNETRFYASALKKLHALKAENTYLYLFDTPIRHKKNEIWECPSNIHLVASQIGNEVISYPLGKGPVLDREHGFDQLGTSDQGHALCVFCLYLDEIQYGILVTEIDPDNLVLSYQITMQITNALRFYGLSVQERRMRRQLEKVNLELNEKNLILNNISSYDAMIGCLNRRGFMEAAMNYNKQHMGERALFVYADMNYLKQINDIFGHNEGDWAIIQAEKMLQAALGEEAIVGRLGGDEFAAVLKCKSDACEQKIRNALANVCIRENAASSKPYYVDVALGIEIFDCIDKLPIEEIMRAADKKLYEDKRNRRGSVYK